MPSLAIRDEQVLQRAVEAGLVVELLARQVAEHVADRPARGAGRPPPAVGVQAGEEPVEPGRLGVEDVERVEPVEFVQQVVTHTCVATPEGPPLTDEPSYMAKARPRRPGPHSELTSGGTG